MRVEAVGVGDALAEWTDRDVASDGDSDPGCGRFWAIAGPRAV